MPAPTTTTGVQGTTNIGPNVNTAGTGGNQYADYMAQFLDYLTNPAAYGGIPQIPATSTNVTTTSPQTQLYGYPGLNQQASQFVSTGLAGQLDPSVLANIGQTGAQRGWGTGSMDSPNANAAVAQMLGLTTRDIQQKAMENYMNLLNVTPRDTTQTQTIDNNVLQSIYAAAPNPMDAALANLAAQWLALQAGNEAGTPPGGGGFNLNPGRGAGTTPPPGGGTDVGSGPGPTGGTGPFTTYSPPSGAGLPPGLSYYTGGAGGAGGGTAAVSPFTGGGNMEAGGLGTYIGDGLYLTMSGTIVDANGNPIDLGVGGEGGGGSYAAGGGGGAAGGDLIPMGEGMFMTPDGQVVDQEGNPVDIGGENSQEYWLGGGDWTQPLPDTSIPSDNLGLGMSGYTDVGGGDSGYGYYYYGGGANAASIYG